MVQQNFEHVIDACLEDGVSTLEDMPPIEELYRAAEAEKSLRTLESGVRIVEAGSLRIVGAIVQAIPALRVLQEASLEKGLPAFNSISTIVYDLDTELDVHVDNLPYVGVSVLWPVNHIGKLSVYQDNDFEIGPWLHDYELLGRVERQLIQLNRDAKPEFAIETTGNTAAVLRQDQLRTDKVLRAKPHSSRNISGDSFGFPDIRIIHTLDTIDYEACITFGT